MKHPLTLVWMLLVCGAVSAQRPSSAALDKLLSQLAGAKDDTTRVIVLSSLANSFIYYDQETGLRYASQALQLADSIGWQKGIALAKTAAGRLYWRKGKFDDALKNHFDALSIYRQQGDQYQTASLLTFIGQDYGDNGQYTEAIDYWSQALNIFDSLHNQRKVASIYNLYSWAYENMGDYPEALRYNYASLKIYEELGDSTAIAFTNGNIAQDFVTLGNYAQALRYFRQGLNALKLINDSINLTGYYVNCASVYAEMKSYDLALAAIDTALRIAPQVRDTFSLAYAHAGRGEIYLRLNNYASALNDYRSAATLFHAVSNKDQLSGAYGKLGVCYTYLGEYDSARSAFEKQRALAWQLGTGISITQYYQGMQLLDSMTGNWNDAFTHYYKYVAGHDSIFNDRSLQKLVQVRLSYETEKKEALARAEQEKKDIIRRNIRYSIASGMGGALIFLVVVYRQRNKIAKEKKRSDRLLLNILPEETAEELKATGTAEAKSYEMVTVMFTDFKDFTKAAEWMTAQELVSEINFLFSEFDKIISKHKIEKIKTIGDSYMCAGGLPVPNKTNAADVVNAALEIQRFMNRLSEERRSENKHFFEIRIGIHTGPVVAGIVGLKKFAYDIWGDTVNLAARMESGCEEGLVNISGATYDEIKDQFVCTYRGKIKVKNKGEVDMYYVGQAMQANPPAPVTRLQ
jgi:class 3 adenylate cyclase